MNAYRIHGFLEMKPHGYTTIYKPAKFPARKLLPSYNIGHRSKERHPTFKLFSQVGSYFLCFEHTCLLFLHSFSIDYQSQSSHSHQAVYTVLRHPLNLKHVFLWAL